ncbi:SURF1 family protein [Altericroceibacterium endophyticum]|uniref:SURF1-like protein n=1 Tax=Altericroceibacterium endophyticum TaxID=1808508 RepID=A0A6I4T4F0_9SPHN|nr:SURF1 family cytochrome oxidase biogenesis protein [Altericroceibacterium endophyticum]MXO65618.1 SURF1 family protein [Altericroceibacterium endophyticum]
MNAASTSRSLGSRVLLAGLALLFAAGFAALALWQIDRREWKHDLIDRVESRIHAAPAPAPDPSRWGTLTEDSAAYRHIRLTGHYQAGQDTLVRAVSDLGAGYWVMTPFETGTYTVLINRGFVSQEQAGNYAPPPPARREITGLLRISQPNGGFLRDNDPPSDRWFSRDVQAIAQRRDLERTAPYFLDLDASSPEPLQMDVGTGSSEEASAPVAGLTRVNFPDNHLVYAVTWAALMLFSIWAAWTFWSAKKHE